MRIRTLDVVVDWKWKRYIDADLEESVRLGTQYTSLYIFGPTEALMKEMDERKMSHGHST